MNEISLKALGTIAGALLALGALRTHPDANGDILDPTPIPVTVEADPVESTVPQITVTQSSLPTTIANCDDAVNLARQVGWPEEELDTLAVVMLRESNCTPTAHNLDDPMGGSYGLVQANGVWCEPSSAWPIGW